VVSKGDSRNFLVFNNSLNGVQLPLAANQKSGYRAFIYPQRRLIRPGGQAELLVTLKDKYYQAGDELPVRLEIRDPAATLILNETIKTNQVGAVTMTVPIAESYKTGKYQIKAFIGDEVIGADAFSVETFIPQKIKNSISTSRQHYSLGVAIEAMVSSRYLFGSPAANLPGDVRLQAVAKPLQLTGYEEYSFNNAILAQENKVNYLDIKKEITLDDKGQCQVAFTPKISQSPPSILQGLLAATIMDDGREVASYQEITIYPYAEMVGIKLWGEQQRSDKTINFTTILIDPLTRQPQQRQLFATLKRKVWHYSYNDRGYGRWRHEYKEVDHFSVEPGQAVERQVHDSGSYILEVADRLGKHSATVTIDIRGWGYDPVGPSNDMGKVEVSFADKPYKRGDKLQVGIKSPISGRLLVTLETDRLVWHKTVDLKENSADLTIPLGFDFKDGLYLHTQVVRPTSATSMVKPFRAKSSSYVRPDRSAHRIEVELLAPKETRPNQRCRLQVRSTEQDAFVLLSLVDQGILQIVNQQPPKPFEYFFHKEQEKVAHFDIYDLVMHHLAQGTMLNMGGDDAQRLAKMKKHLAPETGAKRVKPFVYWSNLVAVDSSGLVDFEVTIPNYTGQVEIVALAISADGIGVTNKSLRVKDDVIVKPTLPRLGLHGDTIAVPLRLFNTTNEAVELELSHHSSANLRLRDLPSAVTIAAQGNEQLLCQLDVIGLGKGELTITAKNNGQQFFSRVELPLLSGHALTTQLWSGDSSGSSSIEIPPAYLLPGAESSATLSVSGSFLTKLKGKVNSLVRYPHGCAEQTSSKMLAMLNIDSVLKGISPEETAALQNDRRAFIRAGIAKLSDMQRPDGDFTYWPGTSRVNRYASVYASDILLSAKEQGFPVADEVIRGIYSTLTETVINQNSDYFTDLYAAYLLAQAGKLQKSLANTYYDQGHYKKRGLVAQYMMAAILQQMGMEKQMIAVLKGLEDFRLFTMTTNRRYGGNFYSRQRDIAFALYLHAKHFKKNEISQQLLADMAERLDRLYSTQDTAFALRALQEYYRDINDEIIDVNVTLNGSTSRYTEARTISQPVAATTITIAPKSGVANYSVEVTGYTPRPVNHGAAKQGKTVRIRRDFVDAAGQELDLAALSIGQQIYAKTTISASKSLKNLAIVDRYPSCLEISNKRLDRATLPNELKNINYQPDYVDIRDDRVLTFLSIDHPGHRRKKENTIIFYTPLRVTFAGSFIMPAAQVEAMYDSRLHDYDRLVETITVTSQAIPAAPPATGLQQDW